MIKTPLSTVIGGAFWTPSATVIGGASKTLNQLIKSLFANNEQGFAYDPNDLSTMFQDAAGTVPVTGAGQAVGLIRDKSGRGNHAYQTVSASRPILRQNATTGAYYLAFDGSDDFLQTSNIDFTATDKVSLFTGIRKLSDAQVGILAEFSAVAVSNNGAFAFYAPPGAATQSVTFVSRGTVNGISSYTNPQVIAPVSVVMCGIGSVSTDTSLLRVNGAEVVATTTDQGTGNYGNYPLYIGRRAGTSNPFNGHIYSLIGVGRLSTESEIAAIEKELAKRTGVTLNV